MHADTLRRRYIDFFTHHQHAAISGRSLVPENDPTVLFTTAGMHPLVPYLLGQPHPAGNRLVNCQQCIRTGDIDAVGDPSHLTFFEMLGNWSLGDYFKEEAIRYSFEFVTSAKWLNIPRRNISVTVFAGNDTIPRDEESARIWMKLGLDEGNIHYLSADHNWWGPAGQTGPCGPDTEIFIAPPGTPPPPHPAQTEIWNNVFMQYQKDSNGSYLPLGRTCVDTGMGVERTICMLQGASSVYETELFAPIMDAISAHTSARYGSAPTVDRSLRIIADHLKAATMIIGDAAAIVPSNVGQGYILRRLIRRAMRHGKQLGISRTFLHCVAPAVVSMYADVYPQVQEKSRYIYETLRSEEEQFMHTLQRGEIEFNKALSAVDSTQKVLPGKLAFRLYDTYGFPLELTQELAAEKGLAVDIDEFNHHFQHHREISKHQSTFKGGLADNTIATTRLHTATHLLHQALRDVLGDHVAQRGSNITPQRLRFDFSHPAKINSDHLRTIENIVNRQINNNLPVTVETMPLKEAQAQGAIALFAHKYDEVVQVYSIGRYSKEVCGGPHVKNTAELGHFRIIKEQSSSQGVRRIKATLTPPSS